jgi:hypothetical protein
VRRQAGRSGPEGRLVRRGRGPAAAALSLHALADGFRWALLEESYKLPPGGVRGFSGIRSGSQPMSQEQQVAPEDSMPAQSGGEQQQSNPEAHAGHGSESAMEQLKGWEERRSVSSGGKRRPGPN